MIYMSKDKERIYNFKFFKVNIVTKEEWVLVVIKKPVQNSVKHRETLRISSSVPKIKF